MNKPIFRKGQQVVHRLHGAGETTVRVKTVLKSSKGSVWLDNGDGNDPSGPFIDGQKDGVFGFWEEIIPLKIYSAPNSKVLEDYEDEEDLE